MESISELRKICQTAFKRERKDFWSSNIYGHFVRIFSIYVTRLILPFNPSANQVTFAMILVGISATCFFLSPSQGFFLFGALLMQFWYTLDGVDGEVARYHHYKRTGSLVMNKRDAGLTGMYFDMINHYVINFLVPLATAFGLFQKTQRPGWILLGSLAALTQVLMLAMYDTKNRAQLNHLKRFARAEIKSSKDGGQANVHAGERSFAHWLFIALHKTLIYPEVMNMAGMAGILNFLVPAVEWRIPFLCYVAFGTLIVSVTIIGRTVRHRLVEQEFQQDFQASD